MPWPVAIPTEPLPVRRVRATSDTHFIMTDSFWKCARIMEKPIENGEILGRRLSALMADIWMLTRDAQLPGNLLPH